MKTLKQEVEEECIGCQNWSPTLFKIIDRRVEALKKELCFHFEEGKDINCDNINPEDRCKYCNRIDKWLGVLK